MNETPISERIPAREKLAYSMGTIPFGFAYMALAQLAYPVFNITLGISATLIGLVMGVGRLWDAITDPFVGMISDNTRSRWGRRRPYILLGGLLLSITFPLIWAVPTDWSHNQIFAWLLVSILLFYTASTVFCVPWLSLSYEISPDPIERTRVQTYRAYVNIMVALSMPWVYRFAQSDFFADTMTGVRIIAWGMGACMLIFSIPVFVGCQERFWKQASHQKKIALMPALKATLSNKPFMFFVLGVVTALLCTHILVGSLALYINSYYIFAGDTKAGAEFVAFAAMVAAATKFVILPFCSRLCRIYGKLALMRWSQWVSLVGSISTWFLYTPSNPYFQYIAIAMLAPSAAALWLLVDPTKADCADYDEWNTGLRREGMYAAVANWIEKLCISLILVFSGMILDLSGFDSTLGADQPEHTMTVLRLCYMIIPAIGNVMALVTLYWFPLTDKRMGEIRADLKARRGEASADAD